jgi:hypothetical protein
MRAPGTRTRAALAAILAFAGASAMPARSRADEHLSQRTTGAVVMSGRLLISVGLQDLFGPAERQHLTSGFSTRVLIRVALKDATHDEEEPPLAVAVQRAEIVYDIWDEKFSVRVTRGLGAELRAIAASADDAIWRATALWQFPIADTTHLRAGGRYVVMVRGDLNPISEDLVADVHRWLVQPARGQRKLGAGDSFFGSFVSIFVNPHVEDSERQLRFVSQPFALPNPLPPPPPMVPPARAAGGAVVPPKVKVKR